MRLCIIFLNIDNKIQNRIFQISAKFPKKSTKQVRALAARIDYSKMVTAYFINIDRTIHTIVLIVCALYNPLSATPDKANDLSTVDDNRVQQR